MLRRAATATLRRTQLRPHRPVAALALPRVRPLCTAAEKVTLVFVEDGEEVEVEAEVGKTILEVAQEHEIDLEGACDGSLACSTCHVIFEQDHFDDLPDPEEEEEDMLDLAFGLTDTSRLGCQIKVPADGRPRASHATRCASATIYPRVHLARRSKRRMMA